MIEYKTGPGRNKANGTAFFDTVIVQLAVQLVLGNFLSRVRGSKPSAPLFRRSCATRSSVLPLIPISSAAVKYKLYHAMRVAHRYLHLGNSFRWATSSHIAVSHSHSLSLHQLLFELKVLLDENFMEFTRGQPLPMQDRGKVRSIPMLLHVHASSIYSSFGARTTFAFEIRFVLVVHEDVSGFPYRLFRLYVPVQIIFFIPPAQFR